MLTIEKNYNNQFEVARKYYSILFELNGYYFSKLELDLIAYTAVRGYITTVPAKKDFIRDFDTTDGTVNNLVSKLKRLGILIKENNKIKVQPKILLDFSKGITLNLTLNNEEKGLVDKEDERPT